ncbi:hypothetical protein NWP21_01310 [Anabaenopsis sp. FSS-46]|uniref:hypothetical protein n=1 Tax=Anabaenopsis sp. FSS-46 TaxID=2971766 RepID=UPI002475ADD4|nr:hypothetical protein [Anabaenopsis sp. FSS-46]MDH6097502.1 hypothetical protein [Anabaenopsis sp. FSS-46]
MLPSKRGKGNLFSLEQEIQSQKPSQPEFTSSGRSLDFQQSQTFESINTLGMAKRPKNSLFSLEQTIANQINSSSNQKAISHQVETFAFDDGVAIELQYDFEALTNSIPVDDSLDNSLTFALENKDQVYSIAAFEVSDDGDDGEFNQVEAFEITQSEYQKVKTISPLEEEKKYKEQPANSINANLIAVTTENISAIPIDAKIEPSTENHTSIESVPPLSTVNQENKDDADTLALAADIEPIWRGDKAYEPNNIQSSQAFTQSRTQTLSAPQPQDIFEQMGRDLSHATAFDVGTVSLEATFDEFDKLLDQEND